MVPKVIIHSFHSEVPKTLQRIDLGPDFIIALDSHLDVYLPIKSNVDSFPEWIRSAATRATVHTLIRRRFGDFPPLLKSQGLDPQDNPRMVLVVPKVSLETHVTASMESMNDLVLGGAVTREEIGDPLKLEYSHLSEALGIEPYTSPPKNLMKVIELSETSCCPYFDIDVDYFQDMQSECYTPVGKAQPGQLGWTTPVLKLIHKLKPQLITVSEVKVEAAKNPDSNFRKFIAQLASKATKSLTS